MQLEIDGFRLTWLDGGAFRMDGGSMFGPVPRSMWSKRYPCDEMNLVPLEARVVLVETPQARVLVESGFGHHLTERQKRIYNLQRRSRLLEGLASAGLRPADIDYVVLTHLHLDHAGGVVELDDKGRWRPTFPRARHVVQRAELAEATYPHERSRHVYSPAAWHALEAAQLVDVVDGPSTVVPGLEVFRTGGHSVGHQGIRLGQGGAVLLHLGDLLPTNAHLNPLWVSAADDYPMESIAAKRQWLGWAAQRGWWVAFSHDFRLLAGRCHTDLTLAQVLEAGE